MKRDPRNDPRGGDIVRSPSGLTHSVTRVEDGVVYYTHAGRWHEQIPLNVWIDAAKNDEVIRVAGEDREQGTPFL